MPTITASCRCGAVALEAEGAPIVGAACCCHSCQEAGARFEALAGAPPVLSPYGGTDFLLYRKDRVRCVRGGEGLTEHRLKPDSSTRRMTASCCNSPMFLEFKGGHWVSVYRDRFDEGAPPVELRTMASDAPAGVELPDDMPNAKTHSAKFIWRMLTAWIAMGFRAPKLQGVPK